MCISLFQVDCKLKRKTTYVAITLAIFKIIQEEVFQSSSSTLKLNARVFTCLFIQNVKVKLDLTYCIDSALQ